MNTHHDTLARNLVDLATSSHSVVDYYASALEVLAGVVGFDNAVVFSPKIVDGSPFIYGMRPESRPFVQSFLQGFPAYGAAPARAARLATIHEVVTDEQIYADLGVRRERDPFQWEILRPAGITSILDLGVRLGPHVFGFISLHRVGGRRFSTAEVSLLKPVAPVLGAAVAAIHQQSCRPLSHHLVKKLAVRELEVVELVARGLSNKDVATYLGTSPNTVRNQLHSIFAKLSINSRAELVRMALACR